MLGIRIEKYSDIITFGNIDEDDEIEIEILESKDNHSSTFINELNNCLYQLYEKELENL